MTEPAAPTASRPHTSDIIHPVAPATEAELTAFLAAHPDTVYVDALFFDLCGIVRGKRYPVADAPKLYRDGMLIPYSAFLLDVTGDCPDPGGRGFSDGDPDAALSPLAGSLVPVPWSEVPCAQVHCSVEEDPAGTLIDPRNVLRRVARRLRADGLHPVVAMELEFYLIDPNQRSPDGAPLPPVSPGTGARDKATQVYGMAALDDYSAFLGDVEKACKLQNVPAYTATSEYAPGQFEINLKHVRSAVLAADHANHLTHIVERVARKHGFQATFMSKPYMGQAGNGLHVHLSLTDAEGNNLFDSARPGGEETLRHAVGGLMATWPEAMAFFAPNANAYRRFAPNQYVPVTRSWGRNNRSVAFRIPSGGGDASRIEHRVAGADANHYLALACILAGAHHGITNRLDPGPQATGNAGTALDDGIPWTWRQALTSLEKAKILPGYLGAEYLYLYGETKWAELERFQAHIAPHEYAWYL